MKLFPGGHPGFRAGVTVSTVGQGTVLHSTVQGQTSPGQPQPSYPADFSNYGPMYSSYYQAHKQAAAMAGGGAGTSARSSPYPRNMYSPASCYQNFQASHNT